MVDRRESLKAVEAHLSIDGSCTSDLFDTPEIQEPSEFGDATDARGDALETLTTEYLEQDQEPEVSALDEDGDECIAAESDEEIVDETLCQSLMKNNTRSKSQKVVVPAPPLPSDSEDEEHRQQPHKRDCASPASVRAGGHARYFICNSNQSRVSPARSLQTARVTTRRLVHEGRSDQLKTARQETTRPWRRH